MGLCNVTHFVTMCTRYKVVSGYNKVYMNSIDNSTSPPLCVEFHLWLDLICPSFEEHLCKLTFLCSDYMLLVLHSLDEVNTSSQEGCLG